MKHIQTIETRDLCQSLQDQLRYCQSGLREEEQRLSCENHGAALAGRHFWRRDQI